MHLDKLKNKQAILDCLDQIHNRMYDIEENLSDDSNNEITSLRLDVLSLLESSIHFYVRKKAFDLWVKDYLEQAIGWLVWNINKVHITTSMLRACLQSIRNSTIESAKRSKSYPSNKDRIEAIEQLTQEDLIKAINELRERC